MKSEKPGKLVRLVSVVFIAGILAFLALSGVATLAKKPVFTSYFENRSLAALPEYSEAGIMDGSWFSGLNTYLQEHTVGRNTILRAQTLLDMYLLRRPVVNEVVIRDDVLLPWQDFWIYDRDELRLQAEKTADRIAAHARTTEEYGGRFYYVAVPHQALAFPEEYPSYLQSHEDFCLDAAAFLSEALEAREVPFLDMRTAFLDKGILQEASSRIDNHFTVVGAVETCRCLSEQICADTGWDAGIPGDGGFRIEYLPNHYIGSRTRKLFDLWPSEERLGIAVTGHEPLFTRRDTADWMTAPRESHTVYELPETPDEPISYGLYMGGDWGSTVIETGRPELPSILIYGDSFTNPLECLLWQSFDTMYSFDFRHFDELTPDEVIARYRPDLVVCVRDFEALLKDDPNGQ